jgi:hypothetical protein
MNEQYWLHIDTGELDKVPYEHMDYIHRVPHKFGLTDKDVKVLKRGSQGHGKLMKKLFEKHFRRGMAVPTHRAPYVYFQTAKKDDNTFRILKRYLPKKWLNYNPANTEVRWESNSDYLVYLNLTEKPLTNLKQFMKSNTVDQLYQVGMPEYHKTISQYRESIGGIYKMDIVSLLGKSKSVRDVLLEKTTADQIGMAMAIAVSLESIDGVKKSIADDWDDHGAFSLIVTLKFKKSVFTHKNYFLPEDKNFSLSAVINKIKGKLGRDNYKIVDSPQKKYEGKHKDYLGYHSNYIKINLWL